MNPAFFAKLGEHLQRYPSRSIDTHGLQLREAAVLAPLFWKNDEPFAILTRRPMTLRQHPGQIAFPGGRRDPGDTTLLHTALRETWEELGIPEEKIDVLGMLGAAPTITSFQVTPFVGVVPADLPLAPSVNEVEEVLYAPLWRLRREKRRFYEADRDAFVWDAGEHAVWGATHRMLEQLMEHVDAIGR